MDWLGNFSFGHTSAIYTGRSGHNALHEHAAIQIIFHPTHVVELSDAGGNISRGYALFVPPLVRHAVPPNVEASILYIDAKSPMLPVLVAQHDERKIHKLSRDRLPFALADEDRTILSKLDEIAMRDRDDLDRRLTDTLELLAERPGEFSIHEVALKVGLSASRLRALARRQIGFSLSTWILWRKLERSAKTLANGASLADAALAGGFSDQAHFTRTMRRMFGITPMTARHNLTS